MATTFTLAKLVTELQSDPLTLGYAALINASQGPQIASLRELINLKSGDGSASVPALPIQPNTFKSLMNAVEFDGLTGLQLQQIVVQLTGMVDIGSQSTRDWIAICFENCPNTLAALQAAGVQVGSRAEVLWGTNFFANDNQISDAVSIILAS